MERRMNKLCRICFEEPQGHLQDFEPYEQLVENIIQCKPISDPILNLNKICDSCASDLIAADRFRTKCLESEAIIRQIIKSEDDDGITPDQIPARQSRAEKAKKKVESSNCNHCGAVYDPSIISKLLDQIATIVNFQFVALETPSEQICEACLAKYMIASELIERLRTVKFAPHPPKTCSMCGSCKNLCLVDRSIRHLAMKLDPNSSLNPDRLEKICRDCAADFVSTKELLDKKKAKKGVEASTIFDEVDHFDQDSRSMSEDDNIVLEEEEESIEDKPLNERLRGDDFEWPLSKEDIMPNPKRCRLPRFTCDVCFCVLEGTEEKQIHEEAGHDKENRCKYCQMKCNSAAELRRHILKHLPRLWNWTCEICAKNFYCKESFFIHYDRHSAEQYKFKCDTCSKAYTRKAALREHVKMRHLKERNYACTYCPKTYIDCTDLKRHLPTHTGIYPFQCNICPKGFVRKKFLQEHLMTH